MKLKYDPKQMLLAKLFFDHGAEHRAQRSEFSRIQAVIAYANAAELLLKVIADSNGATPSKKYFTIHDLLDNLEKKLPKKRPIPRKLDIYKLADIRNLATHHGTVPSESTVEECHVFTQAFMRDSLRLFFKKAFDDLDMIDYVQSSKAKELLNFAKLNLLSESYFDTRTPAKLAFVILSENLFNLIPTNPSFRYFGAKSRMLSNEEANQFPGQMVAMKFLYPGADVKLAPREEALLQTVQDLQRDVAHEIDEVKAYLALVSLGRSVGELSRFDAISSQINLRYGWLSIPGENQGRNSPEETERSRWFLNYVTELVIQMEEMGVGDSVSEHYQHLFDETVRLKGRLFGSSSVYPEMNIVRNKPKDTTQASVASEERQKP